MTLRIPIGIDDFRMLRELGYKYVDKSQLICEILDRGMQVVLLPRPRRFGKSLNLSMLRCFFEKQAQRREVRLVKFRKAHHASRAHGVRPLLPGCLDVTNLWVMAANGTQ